MDPAPDALPDDVAALKAALIAERAKCLEVAAELAVARAKASEDMALIAAQKLRIAKLERQIYGQRSERSERLIEQLSLTFEELAANATEDELAAEQAVAKATNVRAFTRRGAERDTFPDHLPRERVVMDPPTACECCGGTRLRKLGEDVTRTLETSPRLWKVIETVREKFSCRDCEKISQVPAPFHVIPRAWAGPSLLAMIVFEKFGQHQPLNRQAERYALEGAPIALSTMADAVGAVCATLDPLRRLIEAHVTAAERLHGDDTPCRCWRKARPTPGGSGRTYATTSRSAARNRPPGAETGMFEVPAGGRRFRALELLVKHKQLARTAPIPCVVRTEGLAEEDSLAENIQRAPLHPLDQFRAFLTLREKGKSEEEIAASFFVSVAVVRQRLRLAAVSPKLLDVYAEDGMTLDQLMAFTVNPDHARQEQVWEALQRSYTKEPHQIRRMLTEGAVRASDKRAQFVGVEAYEAAGGVILRDLFNSDDGGWLQDPALLHRLLTDKLDREAEAIRAENWMWVEVAPDFPYGHTYDLRRLIGEQRPLTDEETTTHEALRAEFDRLEKSYAEANEIPHEVDQRLSEIETALAAFEERPVIYDAAEIARAGAFVSIDGSGGLRIERGYVRPEDEPRVRPADDGTVDGEADETGAGTASGPDNDCAAAVGGLSEQAEPPEEDEGVRPIPDRLVTELTAHRTLALRDALASDPDVAFLAALHVLCLKLFYRYALDSCLEIEPKSAVFGGQAPGLADTSSAKAIDARHAAWTAQLPKEPGALWDVLTAFDHDSRQGLFAHCVALTLNAVSETYNRRPKAIAHADRIAQAVALDMAAIGWRPTVDSYLGRVTKGRILQALTEARGDTAVERVRPLKKAEMAKAAEDLLIGTGWLPEPLRTPGQTFAPGIEPASLADDDGQSAKEGRTGHG